jgi:hypothetical protein
MKTVYVLTFIVTVCLILSLGCTSSVTKVTGKELFHVKLSAKGQLLRDGRNELDIYITDGKGLAVEGATIEIKPWMPEHGHGAMWPPTVTEKGRGLYSAVIPLTMMGHWELQFRIRKGDVEDTAVFDFPNVLK